MTAALQSKNCSKCGVLKPLSEFYPWRKSIGRLRPDCRDCAKARHNEWRATAHGAVVKKLGEHAAYERRRLWLDKQKAQPCADCKQTYPSYVMDFDHVRGKKIEAVSRLIKRSFELLKAEVAKCDVVCANCHRIRTHERRIHQAHEGKPGKKNQGVSHDDNVE